jgi:hypothetical protein
MVEIAGNPLQTAIPQQAQTNSPQQAGALPSIGINNAPDSVIAATTQSQESNVRGDDAFRRQQSGSETRGIPSLKELTIGVSTRVAFDSERSGRVVLEISSNSGQAIARIPSESLVQYLESQFRQENNVQTLQDGEKKLP